MHLLYRCKRRTFITMSFENIEIHFCCVNRVLRIKHLCAKVRCLNTDGNIIVYEIPTDALNKHNPYS